MQFKIYRSSAGSGKTFTLAKEYLKLALAAPMNEVFQPSYYKQILAVTFTNDAANEMKERIMGYLSDFAKGKNYDEGMKNAILSELSSDFPQLNITEEIFFKRVKKIHEHLLHNYSDFSVSTIDSFNNRVVQSFKKDLQLPYNYEIELDTAELREEASDMLQNRVKEKQDGALNELLVEFALNKADDGKSWYIDHDLEGFANNLFHEEKHEVIAQLAKLSPQDFKQAKNDLFKYIKEVETSVKEQAQKAIDLIAQHQIEIGNFARGNAGIGKYFEKNALLEEPFQKTAPNSYVVTTVEKNKWTKGGIDATEKSAIEFISGDLAGFYYAIEHIREQELSNYILAYSLRSTIYLLATITELSKHMQTIKEEKGIVHISEFNRKINQIVEDEPVPYIYERMGEKYMHILIDEFQDTSQMQWHNLIPLLTNALGFGMQNMVVGDAKQAVYRWRGGKASMLVKLPEVPTAQPDSAIAQQADIFRSQANPQVLETNFRSRANIIEFNNTFFENCRDWLSPEYPELTEYYAQVFQKTNKKTGGHVQIELLEKDLKKPDYESATFERVLSMIEDALQQGFSKRDIALLTRTNTQGAFLAEKLLEKNIPVVSSDSLLVKSSPSVQFLVMFFGLLNQPLDPLNKVNLALFIQNHFNLFSARAKTLELDDVVRETRTMEAESGLDDMGTMQARTLAQDKEVQAKTLEPDNVVRFSRATNKNFNIGSEQLKWLQEVAAQSDLMLYNEFLNAHFEVEINLMELQLVTLYEKTEELIRVFKLHLDPKQQVYLHKFLDFVLEFGNRFGNDLEQFLDYWDRKSKNLSVSMPKTNDAVRIMTIHKSKGLQFPVVMLPFADWEMKPKPGSTLWQTWEGNQVAPTLPSVILNINSDLEKTEFAELYHAEKQATFLDSFNLLYVAFTRAESQLFIIGQDKTPSKDDAGLSNICHLLNFYLEQSKISTTDYLSFSFPIFGGGSQETEAKQYILYADWEDVLLSGEKKMPEQMEAYPISQFFHTKLKGQIGTRRETAGKLEAELQISDLFDAREQGILVHYAFEKVRYKADIPKAIRTLISEGKIAPEDANSLEECLFRIANLPELSAYFTPTEGMRVENEKEILIGLEYGQLRTARPDRVVFMPDHVVIIDYKTGYEKEKEHQRQVKEYGFFFRKMGYKNQKLLLVYTEEEKVVEVE